MIEANEILLPKVAANSDTFNAIVGLVYTFIAAWSVFFIIFAGIKYMISGDNPEEIKKARRIILYAVISLAGSTTVFAVIGFVARSIG